MIQIYKHDMQPINPYSKIRPINWLTVETTQGIVDFRKTLRISELRITKRRRMSSLKNRNTFKLRRKQQTLMIACFFLSMRTSFLCAKLPQSKKTTPSSSLLIVLITKSVNFCQPSFEWEFAEFFLKTQLYSYFQKAYSTVRVAFNKKIPFSAHRVKFPWFGILKFGYSFANSLKMFFNEGGWVTPGGTEKLKPCAWPCPWYGSCPIITTRTCLNGVKTNALKMRSTGG